MAKPRHLSRAPIREALIDIQFSPAADLESVAAFAHEAAGLLGSISDLWETTLELTIGVDGAQQSNTGTCVGKRIDFPGLNHVLQLRTTGFTFSRLPPYETWEAMSEHALKIGFRYLAAVRPEHVVRLAVRYINTLQIPLPVATFKDYLTCPPQIPSELPQGLASFLSRVGIAVPEYGDVGVVTQVLEGMTPEGNALSILLDIDVSHLCKLDGPETDKIREVLDRLRTFKNDAFFGFLEEKTLEQYT
ncbi:TIGR04255 family protein [Pseudomonas sp. S2_B07]